MLFFAWSEETTAWITWCAGLAYKSCLMWGKSGWFHTKCKPQARFHKCFRFLSVQSRMVCCHPKFVESHLGGKWHEQMFYHLEIYFILLVLEYRCRSRLKENSTCFPHTWQAFSISLNESVMDFVVSLGTFWRLGRYCRTDSLPTPQKGEDTPSWDRAVPCQPEIWGLFTPRSQHAWQGAPLSQDKVPSFLRGGWRQGRNAFCKFALWNKICPNVAKKDILKHQLRTIAETHKFHLGMAQHCD